MAYDSHADYGMVQVGIDAYIPALIVSIRSNLTHLHGFQQLVLLQWFMDGNHFFHWYQKGKSSESKVKFRQASNRCKTVLEASKLAYANKTRVHHFPETWLSLGTFGELLIVFSTKKVNLVYLLLFNGPEVLSSASDKAKLFVKKFSKNSNLNDSGISLPVFPSIGRSAKIETLSKLFDFYII